MPVLKEEVLIALDYYMCEECMGFIMPGELYTRLSGSTLTDGKPYKIIMCKKCRRIEDDEK